MARSSVIVVGAGVAGLACALELAERGLAVEIVERGRALGDGACSWMAGGMLAPWCERATTEPEVVTWGAPSIAWWAERFPGIFRIVNGRMHTGLLHGSGLGVVAEQEILCRAYR